MLADLLNRTDQKMNLKNNNISVKDMIVQKIIKLKIIIILYKQDLYPAIVDLNVIYNNYKKFIEEKNKENEKYLKKERYSVDINLIENRNNININYIENSGNNKKYFYSIIISLIYFFLIIIFVLALWRNYNLVCNRIQK